MYSLTVLGETEQLWAIARCDSLASYFNLKISSIFRMDNLTWGISSSWFVRIQEKRMTYLFVIIQCRRVSFMLLGRRSDRHGRNG